MKGPVAAHPQVGVDDADAFPSPLGSPSSVVGLQLDLEDDDAKFAPTIAKREFTCVP